MGYYGHRYQGGTECKLLRTYQLTVTNLTVRQIGLRMCLVLVWCGL